MTLSAERTLAEAAGGRLVVFEGLGPAVAGRWPVAMNLVLRDFFESVARPGREIDTGHMAVPERSA
jgi:hypothetical protein